MMRPSATRAQTPGGRAPSSRLAIPPLPRRQSLLNFQTGSGFLCLSRHFFALEIGHAALSFFHLIALLSHKSLYNGPLIRLLLPATMMIHAARFNCYLLVALSLVGCSSTPSKSEKKREALLRLHLEVHPDGLEASAPVSVGRANPFPVNVEKHGFLNEYHIQKATLVELMGGFSIAVQFDREGAYILEQYTSSYPGRRIAVSAEFGEIRWLAAPRITKRIANGEFVFTPDCTRAEAEKIIDGLNLFAKRVQQGRK
jgi:hypothetical protein